MEKLGRELVDGVLHLEIDVPGKKNALTDTVRADLRQAVTEAQGDSGVAAILICGAGGGFCSGGDISAMTGEPEVARRRMDILHDVVRMLIAGRKPAVAAVCGPAFGAGLSLALCCDQVLADTTARFSASFGRVGLPPDLALTWTLPRRVGEGRARRILLSSRLVEAEEALAIGLVDDLVPLSELRRAAHERAVELASFTRESKGHVKALMSQAAGSLDDILAREMDAYIALLNSEEHRRARAQFLSRRR
ncbi:enoyl-CoA hydratase/isomerase family protein [uncultured Tistrella sp.]|uniref:enoyl-CoA hydratase/isomerase family protein n=1 Tax=Tistrella mobilis TaxID=171437 RepID=UPI000C0A83C9|nr:enoyl-CoA hydratase-related protein [uncultured Tistrella sp.]MAM72772.1 enoyl-CoA hydratase [Tistrella sp.]